MEKRVVGALRASMNRSTDVEEGSKDDLTGCCNEGAQEKPRLVRTPGGASLGKKDAEVGLRHWGTIAPRPTTGI
jgi:hypothetical protein